MQRFTTRIVFLCLLGTGLQTMPVLGDAPRFAADHGSSDLGTLETLDLAHGVGTARLTVRRVWVGAAGIAPAFGPGWGDANRVRLAQIDPEQFLVLRAGVGWRLLDKNEQGFAGPDGSQLTAAVDGWSWRLIGSDRLDFNRAGNLMGVTTALGTTHRYDYDAQGRLTTITAGSQNVLTYRYDERSRVVGVEGPEGLTTRYAYDAGGRLATVVNAQRIELTYRYAADGTLESCTDSFGTTSSLPAAVAQEEPTVAGDTPPLALGLDPSDVTLNAQGLVERLRTPLGIERYTYDERGRRVAAETPAGTTRFEYDPFGRLTKSLASEGTSRFEYDAWDRPLLVERADGTPERFEYTPQGLLTRRSSSADDWETIEYDAAGRPAVVRRPPAQEERYGYDVAGRVAEIRYADGAAVRFTYADDGRTVEEQWADGRRFRRTEDAQGRLIERQDAAGLTTRLRYDVAGRLVASDDSLRGVLRYLDGSSALQTVVEQSDGSRTTYEYLGDGRLARSVDPLGRSTFFQYDGADEPSLVRLATGRAWSYAYDAAGRWTGVRGPDGLELKFERDTTGRLTTVRRGTTEWRRYAYDARGQLTAEDSPLGSVAKYRYDAEGRLEQAELPEGGVQWRYAPDGLERVLTGPGYVVQERLHADGATASLSYQPNGLELSLPHDAHGRAAGIAVNGLRADYEYDERGLLCGLRLPGGPALGFTADAAGRITQLTCGAVRIQWAYDALDRPTLIDAVGPTGVPLFHERYAYDSAGNLVSRAAGDDAPNATVRYAYDAEDRLTEIATGAGRERLVYDGPGNLIRSESDRPPETRYWEINAQQQLTAVDAERLFYDAAGSLALLQSPSGTTETTFDAAGRLVRLDQSAGVRRRFGYLPDGDRLWQEGPGGRTWYAYLPGGLAALQEPNGTVWLIVRFPGTDRPAAFCGSNGKTYLTIVDRLGSVRRLVDPAGTVVASRDFNEWGEITRRAGATPWAEYAGMLVEEHGLWYARQRYYSPTHRRFLSVDPLWGAPGEPATHQPYAYAADNPLRYTDPQGAEPEPSFYQVLEWTLQYGDKFSSQEAARVRQLAMQQTQLEQILNGGAKWSAEMKAIARRKEQELAFNLGTIFHRHNNRALVARGLLPFGPRDPVRLNPQGPSNPSLGTFQRGDSTRQVRLPGGGRSFLATGGRAISSAQNVYNNAYTAAAMGIRAGAAYVGWLDGPSAEARRNQQTAQHTANELRTFLVNVLNDPTRITKLPPRADGQPWDPKNPEHFDDLFNGVHNNVGGGSSPFAGIAAPVDDAFQKALAGAQGLLTSARVYQRTIRTALTDAAKKEAQALTDLQKALALAAAKGALYAQLLGMPTAAQEVRKRAGAAEQSSVGLADALTAADEAKTKAETAATTSCGYAGKSGTTTELEAWRRESETLLQTAQTAVAAAEGKYAPTRDAAGQLRDAMNALRTYKEAAGKLIDLDNAVELLAKDKANVTQLLAAAQNNAAAAETARQGIPEWLGKLQAAVAQIDTVLQPYAGRPQADLLLNQARGLPTGLTAPSSLNIGMALTTTKPMIDAFVQNLDALTGGIGGVNALQVLADAQVSLEKVVNSDARQCERNLAAAQASLAQARNCMAKLGGSADSPPPDLTTVPEGKVKVPVVTGMKINEAVAAVRKAGLIAAPELVGEFPVSVDKTTVTAQDPSAGVEVDTGTSVTIGFSATVVEPPGPAPADIVEVPNLVGVSARQAYANLAGLSLVADARFDRTVAPAGKAGTVKTQNPPAGTRISRQIAVELEIYGQVVPSVIGWRASTANDILGEVGLRIDRVAVDRRPPTEDLADRVYSQNPPGGEPISPDNKLVGVQVYGAWETGPSSTPTIPPAQVVQGGFRPGDGALVDPRFAAAKVTDGTHPEAVKDLGWNLVSGGPASELSFTPIRNERNQNDLPGLTIRRFSGPDELNKVLDQLRRHYKKLKAEESGDAVAGTKLQLFQDTPADLHWEFYVWFVPRSLAGKPWYNKNNQRYAVYRDRYLITTGRMLSSGLSGKPIAQDANDGLEEIVQKSKKLIDMRFPK